MAIMDEVLVGDGVLGNYVVGFFSCRTDDEGVTAEKQILRAYKMMGYKNVRPIWVAHCLNGVVHEGFDQDAIRGFDEATEQKSAEAFKHLHESTNHDTDLQVKMIKKYRTENFTG